MGDEQVSLRSSEPIFPVADVVATVRFYRTVLGFADERLWGDPPDFGEVPLGQGMLDLKRICQTIARARPKAKFTLEMITRNPLKIPCLSERYWATFPDRSGECLARTLSLVRAHKIERPLPRPDALDPAVRLRLEEDNVRQCLAYAREQLGFQPSAVSEHRSARGLLKADG